MMTKSQWEREGSEGVTTVEESRECGPRGEEGAAEPRSREDDLLIAVIVLATVVFVLILVIIYCHCRIWRRKRATEMEDKEKGTKGIESEKRERSSNMREKEEVVQQSTEELLGITPEVIQLPIPVKARKRSMTFSETDEECRRYREALADPGEEAVGPLDLPSPSQPSGSSGTHDPEKSRFRKKSVVTFVGVQEVDSNEM